MIKTIALLGAGPTNSSLAIAFALKAPDGFLMEVFDTDERAVKSLRNQLSSLKLKSPSLWFSNTAEKAAWGADVIVLDLPTLKILPMLRDIAGAPNDHALVTSGNIVPPKTSERMIEFIKKSGLTYADYSSARLKSIWKDAGVYAPEADTRVHLQTPLKFDKT